MYELMVKGDFNAAHRLKGYSGECANPHGHNFKVEAIVWGKRIDETGMVIDLKEVKEKLDEILKDLDHKDLNELSLFKGKNPTSENIARYIYKALSEKIDKVKIKQVRVFETDYACVGYSEESV